MKKAYEQSQVRASRLAAMIMGFVTAAGIGFILLVAEVLT